MKPHPSFTDAPEFSADHIARLLAPNAHSAFLPTSQQREVIEAGLEPRLVIAGAGSGKTATMAQRVVFLVANRIVEPSQILGLTFTRKAAGELAERIRYQLRLLSHSIPDLDLSDFPKISTYNSFAASLMSDHGLRIGANPESVLLSEAAMVQLTETLITQWPGELTTQKAVSTLTNAVMEFDGEFSEHGITAAELTEFIHRMIAEMEHKNPGKRSKGPKTEARKLLASLQERLEVSQLAAAFAQLKKTQGVVGFGDQVRIAADLARHIPQVRESLRQQYPVVLLDEYQDTSIAQVQLLSGLFGEGHPVTAVGDPNQAIYGWRGAAAGTLLDFPQTFTTSTGEPAAISHLTVAWRNSTRILEVANTIAQPLQSEQVQPLAPAPNASAGKVDVAFHQTYRDEAAHIAQFLQENWHQSAAPGAPHRRTAAVLCRQRKQFTAIAEALHERGIPVQIPGVAGLLYSPEVQDVWRMLQVIADPSRGDALMRLLTGPYAVLGAADIRHLWRWASSEDRTEAALADGVLHLPPEGWQDPFGHELTSVARERLTQLNAMIAKIRDLTHLELPDLVVATYRAMGLDIELLSRSANPGRALENLREFTRAAATFAATNTNPTLHGFLAWLDAAAEHEKGLAAPEVEVRDDCVQLLTIHAAKGLEWDVVVVAGLNDGDFPTTKANEKEPKSSGWLSNLGALPYELRGDHENLPLLDVTAPATYDDLDEAIVEFTFQEGKRSILEERRLAYVALTRPRHHLLLTGSYWGTRTTRNTPSMFLSQAARALGLSPEQWLPEPQSDENPTLEHAVEGLWPHTRPDTLAHLPAEETTPTVQEQRRIEELVDLLLAERNQHTPPVDPPAHLSASAVVRLADDPQEFMRQRLRPIPQKPSFAARRGTQFHAWVEQHFGSRSLLDWQELPGWEETEDDSYPSDLIEAFRSSPWVDRTPLAVEADIETEFHGMMIRCRIDAIFESTHNGETVYEVVDWKTGRPPTDEATKRARNQQLLLYRIAWSRFHDVPLEKVRAAFHYVGAGITEPGGYGTQADIEQLLATTFADRSGSAEQ